MYRSLNEFIEEHANKYANVRRDLHRHPEIGFEEKRTSELVAKMLTSWGYEVTTGVGKTGVVGTLRNGNSKKVLGLRADMDALPMQENSGKEWASTVPNKFHGCGHDGHTATLLFAAEWLAQAKPFNGTLHLIFQPAEELLIGGKVMLEDGLFKKFPCDAIFAVHNFPGWKKGSFNFRKGAMLASSDTLQINVKGTGGHGAIPEKTVDSIVVACHIVTALQTIVSRNVTPFQPAVVTVGSIQSGLAANIINDTATLKLSVRTLDPEVRKLVVKRITEIACGQAQSFGATAEVLSIHSSPVLMNGSEMTDFAIGVARELFDESLVVPNGAQLMGSEDFAFMLEDNPNGCYCFVGAGDGAPVHNPAYDFNDEIMKPCVQYFATLAQRYLA